MEDEFVQIRSGGRSATLAATLAASLVLAGCASGPVASGTGAASPQSQDQPQASAPAAAPSTAAGPPSGGGGQDGSNIDWATVDLTTIDWATMDLGTVDWVAIEDNPTAENLSADDQALIRSRLDPGRATVELGDQTAETQTLFLCASGHENTRSDVYSFTSYTELELAGMRVRVAFDVRDESGTGQTSGDVVYEMQIVDVNIRSPEVHWQMTEAESVTIDGRTVSVSGTFDDLLTGSVVEEVLGSLKGDCGDTSRF
jgi:hypothetical protein